MPGADPPDRTAAVDADREAAVIEGAVDHNLPCAELAPSGGFADAGETRDHRARPE